MTPPDTETLESAALVFNRLVESQADSDHVSIIESALERLYDGYSITPDALPNRSVTENDVARTAAFIDEVAPSRDERGQYKANNDGDRHPDRAFSHIDDFVDTEARYVNGCLPSYREWSVDYVRDGTTIESRTYDHDDEIPSDPTINGVRHECERTERGDGHVTVYVSEHPVRDDVDVVINTEGDDYINLEGHNGPNVTDEEEPISILGSEFDWGMLGPTEAVLNEDPSDVIAFMDQQGWTYRRPSDSS